MKTIENNGIRYQIKYPKIIKDNTIIQIHPYYFLILLLKEDIESIQMNGTNLEEDEYYDENEQYDTRVDDELSSDDENDETLTDTEMKFNGDYEYQYSVENNTIVQTIVPNKQKKKENNNEQKRKHSPIQLSFPIELFYTGGVHQFVLNKKKYEIMISQSCEENTIVNVNINEGKNICQLPIQLKYQTNKYFRRDGNTLIASFVYPKKLKGNIVSFPYILDNIHIPSVVLGKLSYQFDGFGFLNQKTSIKGKYVVYVTYK